MLGIEVLNTSNAGCSNDSIVRRVVENTFDLLERIQRRGNICNRRLVITRKKRFLL